MKKAVLLGLALGALHLPVAAQLPQTQQEYWRQVDEQMRQQERDRWAQEQCELARQAQRAMVEQQEQEEERRQRMAAPPEPPPPDPMSMMLTQAAAMAEVASALIHDLNDPKMLELRKGFWEFHEVKGQYRSAMFTNLDGTISVHGPGGGYSGALLLLWGPNIPAPKEMAVVPVSLRQNEEPPQNVRTFNLGFPSVPNLGTLIFIVPSSKALFDNMEDVQKFTATIDGKVVFSSTWREGKAARDKLAGQTPLH